MLLNDKAYIEYIDIEKNIISSIIGKNRRILYCLSSIDFCRSNDAVNNI